MLIIFLLSIIQQRKWQMIWNQLNSSIFNNKLKKICNCIILIFSFHKRLKWNIDVNLRVIYWWIVQPEMNMRCKDWRRDFKSIINPELTVSWNRNLKMNWIERPRYREADSDGLIGEETSRWHIGTRHRDLEAVYLCEW